MTNPQGHLLFWNAPLAAIAIILAIIWALYRSPWSGFGSYINPKGEVQRYKTLWDWMQMLIVPLALAVFGTWFTYRRESLAREIEEAGTREERLQNYFDRMTELMLDKGLRSSEPSAEVRDIARARTLTVLRSLDGERKAALLRFLYEADLIAKNKLVIILCGADLSGAHLFKDNLSGANLSGADLSGTYLFEANLSKADLSGADLSGAHLFEANLSGAYLSGADLSGANLSGAHLLGAYLSGAHLFEANLSGAHLSGAYLLGANLSGAHLSGANLSGAHLSKANLSGTYLFVAYLSGADLLGANLSGAIGLTQVHVDSAKGSEDTKLPQGLVRPEHWAKPPTK